MEIKELSDLPMESQLSYRIFVDEIDSVTDLDKLKDRVKQFMLLYLLKEEVTKRILKEQFGRR